MAGQFKALDLYVDANWYSSPNFFFNYESPGTLDRVANDDMNAQIPWRPHKYIVLNNTLSLSVLLDVLD